MLTPLRFVISEVLPFGPPFLDEGVFERPRVAKDFVPLRRADVQPDAEWELVGDGPDLAQDDPFVPPDRG